MHRPTLLLLPILLIATVTFAGDLADEPNALDRRPDYLTAVKKLSADIKAIPDYVEPMKKIHAKFHGTPGVFVCMGDSLTQQQEFWAPLKTPGKNMDPKMTQAYALVNSYMKPEWWDKKGAKFANEGGMCASPWGRDNVDKWLKEMNPETTVILFGDNDMDRHQTPDQNFKDFKDAMDSIVKKCLDNGTVVILETLPPRHSSPDDVYTEYVLKIAAANSLPVCDFLGECIARRPTDWDGSKMKEFSARDKRFEAPTLICGDGEHLSCPKAFENDYSEEALKTSGCNLRTYLTLLSYADIIHKVYGIPLPPGNAK